MISAELTATMERKAREAIGSSTSYEIRASDGARRLYGGLNVLKFGDTWQFSPVSGHAVFTPPRSHMRGHILAGLDLYWNGHFQLKELHTQARCPISGLE